MLSTPAGPNSTKNRTGDRAIVFGSFVLPCRRRLQPVAGAEGAIVAERVPLRGMRPAKAGAYKSEAKVVPGGLR